MVCRRRCQLLLCALVAFQCAISSARSEPSMRISAAKDPPDCQEQSDCVDDGDYCNGDEVCVGNTCQHTGNPCLAEQKLCDASLGFCVACIDDSDCGEGMMCERMDRVCVECISNYDCDNGDHCDGDEHCSRDGKCEAGTPVSCDAGQVCDAMSGMCYDCLESSDCSDPLFPICYGSACVQCTSNAGCPEENPLCVEGRCAQCTDDEDCRHDRKCSMEDNMCVRCFDDWECDNHNMCDGVEKCSSARECLPGEPVSCAAGEVCEERSGQCFGCLEDSHCSDPDASRCSDNECVECVIDDNCGAAKPACVEGVCQALKGSLPPTRTIRRRRGAIDFEP